VYKRQPIILNYQTATQKGTYWLLYYKKENQIPIYFDSFGLPPIKEFENIIDSLEYNEIQVQPFGSSICGQLCLYVLYQLENGSGGGSGSGSSSATFDDIIFELFERFKGML